MDTLYRNNNVYIRRRFTIWDPLKRRNVAYTTGTAPKGFFAPNQDDDSLAMFLNCGGDMAHVGDGLWEVKVIGADMMASTMVDDTIIYERVTLATSQYDDYAPMKVSDDRIPAVG